MVGDSPFLQTTEADFYVAMEGLPSVTVEEPGSIEGELERYLKAYGSILIFENHDVCELTSSAVTLPMLTLNCRLLYIMSNIMTSAIPTQLWLPSTGTFSTACS